MQFALIPLYSTKINNAAMYIPYVQELLQGRGWGTFSIRVRQ